MPRRLEMESVLIMVVSLRSVGQLEPKPRDGGVFFGTTSFGPDEVGQYAHVLAEVGDRGDAIAVGTPACDAAVVQVDGARAHSELPCDIAVRRRSTDASVLVAARMPVGRPCHHHVGTLRTLPSAGRFRQRRPP